jgi:predicted Zn-dependent peptidase
MKLSILLFLILIISFPVYSQLPSAPDSLRTFHFASASKAIPMEGGMKLYVYEVARNPLFEAQLIFQPKKGSSFSVPTVEVLSSIIDHGTRKRTREQVQTQLSNFGLHLECSVADDRFILKMRGPSEHAGNAIELLADIATGLSIMPASISESIAGIQTGVHPYPTNPIRILDRALRLTDATTLRIPDIENERAAAIAIRREELLTFHRVSFRPEQATLIVTGGVSAGSMKSAVKKSFHSWPRNNSQPPVATYLENKAADRILWYPGLSSRSAYGALVLTCKDIPSIAASEILKNTLLQETTNGNDLISTLSLSFLQVKAVEHSENNILAVVFVCPPDRTASVVKSLMGVLQKRMSSALTEEELIHVRRALNGRAMIDMSSVDGTAELLSGGVISDGDPMLRFKELEATAKLSASLLSQKMNLFDPTQCRLLLISDSASYASQSDQLKQQFSH